MLGLKSSYTADTYDTPQDCFLMTFWSLSLAEKSKCLEKVYMVIGRELELCRRSEAYVTQSLIFEALVPINMN